MAGKRRKINVVWFRRDLRLADYAPLRRACQHGLPLPLLDLVEPERFADPPCSERHWRFVFESLADLERQLEPNGPRSEVMCGAAVSCFNDIGALFDVDTIFSHEKTGLELTAQRDRELRDWCRHAGVAWRGFPGSAVQRGIDYPEPIVDIQSASRFSRRELWAWRKRETVRLESNRILQRHLRPDHNGKRRGA